MFATCNPPWHLHSSMQHLMIDTEQLCCQTRIDAWFVFFSQAELCEQISHIRHRREFVAGCLRPPDVPNKRYAALWRNMLQTDWISNVAILENDDFEFPILISMIFWQGYLCMPAPETQAPRLGRPWMPPVSIENCPRIRRIFFRIRFEKGRDSIVKTSSFVRIQCRLPLYHLPARLSRTSTSNQHEFAMNAPTIQTSRKWQVTLRRLNTALRWAQHKSRFSSNSRHKRFALKMNLAQCPHTVSYDKTMFWALFLSMPLWRSSQKCDFAKCKLMQDYFAGWTPGSYICDTVVGWVAREDGQSWKNVMLQTTG